MSDSTAEHATVEPTPGERRARRDRRKDSEAGRRGKRRLRIRFPKGIARDLSAIVVLVAAIAIIVTHVRPIFAGKAPLVEQLTQRIPGSAVIASTPHDSTDEERAVSAPGF